MVEAIKKIDKKILIIAGVIVLAPILIIVFLAIIQGCSNSKITPEKYEKKMIEAAEKYFKDKNTLPDSESENNTVDLSVLVEEGYIKSTEKLIRDNTCNGRVSVRRNGLVDEENEGYLNYTVKLECDKYKTNSLTNSIMNDLTTEGSGLYKQENGYLFKGDEVDNYLTLFDDNYRIISIDSEGIIKLVKVDAESPDRYWDVKYNADTGMSSGKNIYEDSQMRKYLIDIYNNTKKTSEDLKQHIVSKDICVGSRDVTNFAINEDSECSNILNNQVISLLGVTDYAKASLDPDCIDLTSKSCRNYNYMRHLFSETWTSIPVSSNSYEVYYIYNGLVRYQSANKYASYNTVIYIDGDEIIDSGNGSKNSPYVIE